MACVERATNQDDPVEAPPGPPPAWHALAAREVQDALGVTGHGLGAEEAAARLALHGPNRLEGRPPTSPLVVFLRQFRSPLILIMVAALGVTLALAEFLDAAVIAAALALNAIVGFSQERKAEHTLRALMSLAVPRARVMRDGHEHEVASSDLVPGDVVVLESGARVPADLRLVSTNGLRVDESLLTGESKAVAKYPEPVDAGAELADRVSMAYSGSIVGSGRGLGVVVATGSATELGAIAGLVRAGAPPRPPLLERMDSFAKIIGVAVLAVSALAFASGVLLGESAREMFRVAVALAVAAVPEGLPVVVTITLAIGVSRMARRNAIIRRLPAVETLGSVTVIASDKTGTLTENRMAVQEIWAGGRHYRRVGGPLDGELLDGDGEPAALDAATALHLTILAGVLANEADVYRSDGPSRGGDRPAGGDDPAPERDGIVATGDPTEVALLTAGLAAGIEPADARAAYPVVAEIPFEPVRRFSATVRAHRGAHHLFVKGAPERVAGMCTQMLTEDGPVPIDTELVARAAVELASRGLRVLAFAHRADEIDEAPDAGLPDGEPSDLVLCGLQAMVDPPRAGVREAIATCRSAGIRVVMITGDHAATAGAIAEQLGIAGPGGRILDGSTLRGLDDEELRAALAEVSTFARVSPEQKLRIVRVLQAQGEVVAVTGDGVNDAPALRVAQIGVAMGRHGTDVASEASDMVLADDNFVSITAAVEEGRVTFDNIRKVALFLVSTGVGTVVAILVAVWLGWPMLMLPAQLLWLNIVTSGLQDLALAFEPGEPGVLRRAPRRARAAVMSPTLWERAIIGGAVMAVGTLVMFRWTLDATGSLVQAQTVALSTMVVFNVFQVGNARSETSSLFRMNPFSNRFLFVATAAAVWVHVAALYLPPTQFVLRVEPIDLQSWVRIIAITLSILVAMEAHKAMRRRYPRSRHRPGPWSHRAPTDGPAAAGHRDGGSSHDRTAGSPAGGEPTGSR